jgi:MFS family permease
MRMERFLVTFLISSLLLTNVAFAQISVENILNILSSLIVEYAGVLFILAFVFLLLLIGGVIKMPSPGASLPMIAFFILILLAFALPQFVTFPDYVKTVPESFKLWELPPAAKTALELIAIPREWGYVPAILYYFILPFAAIYTLVWAFLQLLGIFPLGNVNRILALIITFMTIPMGWFVKMVWALFSFMGAWSVAVFAATFVAGIFFRGIGIAAKEHAEFRKYIQMGKKGTGEILRRLKEARRGTIGNMRQEANYAINAAPALNLGSRVVQKLQMVANPQVDEHAVPGYLDEAIRELEKEL